MSLITAINNAITKILPSKLAPALAEEFELEEDEVLEFLQKLISKELKSTAKGKRAGPKGKDGKGKKTGYMLFCDQERAKLQEKGLGFADISKALSLKWKKVSEKEKAKWAEKATKQNEKNGLAAATPKKTVKKGSTKSSTVKVKRDQKAGVWVAEGTNLVVQSPRNKIVLGKLSKKGKTVPLEKADKQKCKKMGLEIKEEETKSKKQSKKEESDDSDSDSDEEDSDSDSGSDDDTEEDSD